MKAEHPIRINKAREQDPPGGVWEKMDPLSRGRVQILSAARDSLAQSGAVMTEFQRLAGLSPDWDWSRCAVISREWEYLVPVRAFCEAHGIPVQVGNEEIPSFWNLRETRALTGWLHEQNTGVITGTALHEWIEMHKPNPWYALLRQAIEEHTTEVGKGETPVAHFMEWLAEWGRDIRRRQRGLLLLTAHRAKGLEFDHVAVLDGGWDRKRHGTDPDEPRRLYYVAMTRARQTLALARLKKASRLQDTLRNNPSALQRAPTVLSAPSRELLFHHVQANLQDVDLGFAGRRDASNEIHHAVAKLSHDDPLRIRIVNGKRWELLNHAGTVVGRMAKNFEPPSSMKCRSASVHAVIRWSKAISKPEYRDRLKCESWEVVVPELIFERNHES